MDEVDENYPSGLFVQQLEIASDDFIAGGMLSGVVFKLASGDKAAGKNFHADTPEEPNEY